MTNQSQPSPESAEDVFGDTSYSNRDYEIVKFKKEDDSLILRPLPAMKSLRKRARPDCGLYYKLHYGWDILNDKGEKWSHPFLCAQEKDYGKIVVGCAACDLREEHENNYDAIEAKIAAYRKAGKEKGKTPQEIKKATAPLEAELAAEDKWLYDHSADGKFRLPALNQKGEFVIFLMPWNCLKDFRESCRKLNSKGIDPLGNKANGFKGLWFEFTRTGKASPTSDKAQPLQIDQEDGSFKLSYHTLDLVTAKNAQAAIPDLVEEMEKKRITVEQVAALLAGSGDPEENMKILGIEYAKPEGADEDSESAEDVPASSGSDAVGDDPFAAEEPAETVKEELEATAEAEVSDEDEEAATLAAAEAALAAVKAKAAAKKAAATAPATKPVTTTKTTKPAGKAAGALALSEDEFDDAFGPKTK